MQDHRLKESETRLESIARDQGSNVSSLVSLVKENGEIQTQMIVSETREDAAVLSRCIFLYRFFS
jgi:hypothetical protein